MDEALQEALNDHRRLVADETRAFEAWTATKPGSADSSVTYDALRRIALRVQLHEEEIVKRWGEKE